ncbi:MAG: CarD family transcriptional regulator [Elusimicrobiales bacterium]|nr:CarD family transcriptional regulator [Elusimicrobiales bacterium]
MGVRVIKGVPNLSARAWYALKAYEGAPSNLMVGASGEDVLPSWLHAFNSLASLLPGLPSFEVCLWSGDLSERAKAMRALYSPEPGRNYIHVASPEALAEALMPEAEYSDLRFSFKQAYSYARAAAIDLFIKAGYERVSFVEEKGEFAARGSVLDFFAPGFDKPVRLFFSDNKLESIRYFEIDTQHTSGFLTEVQVPPNIFGGPGAPLLSFAGAGWKLFLDCPLPEGAELPAAEAFSFAQPLSGEAAEEFGAASNLNFNSDIALLAGELRRLKKAGLAVKLFCINRGETERLAESLSDAGAGGLVSISAGYIEEGFVHAPSKTAVITSSELFRRRYRFDPASIKPKNKFFKWTDLKVGDFIVHEDYGVGRYLGIKKAYFRNAAGVQVEDSDCLFLEYARGDKLLVPLHDFSRVQKYISSEGKAPRLSHMDTKTWTEMKTRVKAEVEELALDILKLEAERAALKTAALPHGGHLEDEFAASFPFDETPDQARAIAEVLSDLEKELPMNRLVAGDVGFGKTEVAMRAAMRAVANGRQAAVLVPTTILADQHSRNFIKRFAGFPVNIKVISRFVPKAEQKKILQDLARGRIDIIVGTHRLLQPDVEFAGLGVMIADEEHRFGVKDKDKIKAAAKGVHCLLMSATPIPRTLYQSLSSLKSMSVIESAPVGRQAISTFVRPFSEKGAAEAITYELARGGQVYYVHNRVETIDSRRAYLQRLMPELRVAVIHGQMKAEAVETHMWDFLNRKYDVLMATTIIESGLDIPTVNTLIVENAHEMGLAQLYQLRGRIGREKQKAYCYLYFPSWMKKGAEKLRKKAELISEDDAEKKEISEDAVKRLSALEEFTELGSGFRLAMRDLEIRGAGELLGVRQHGFINSIGLEMYIKLLNGEIDRIKGRADARELPEPKIDILVPAFIPEDYVGDDMERLNFYKKLLNAKESELADVLKGFEDISGPAPQTLRNLIEIIRLKKQLAKRAVRSVTQKEGELEIFFLPGAKVEAGAIAGWRKAFGARLSFLPSKGGDGIRISAVVDPLAEIAAAAAALTPRGVV